eukprot:g7374.t1
MTSRENLDERRRELIRQWNERNSTSSEKNEDSKPTDPRRRRRIVWDEEVIAEHDKERGTRQKIDEPDTPYEYAVEEEEEEKTAPIEFNELAAKLDTLKRQRDEGLTDDDVKKKKFEDKRKNHYNMGARMRAMKEQMKREEEEEARLAAAATTEKTD